MARMRTVHVLWDASHLWGLMAWRSLRCLGVPCRLCRAEEIADGGLLGKPQHGDDGAAPVLLVPGGNARIKACRLGAKGLAAIREHVACGGVYLGFCGGAGLALTSRAEGSLNLCPWSRAGYPERLHHLISGHVQARIASTTSMDGCLPPGAAGATLSLPVWWPGRFAPQQDGDVQVLATYAGPDTDLWLADLALSTIPSPVLTAWQEQYGLDLSADHMDGLPLVVAGRHGQGRYVLSYSHLETPASPQANAWLVHLLRGLGLEVSGQTEGGIPDWNLDNSAADLPSPDATLVQALHDVRALLDMGCEQHLFFRRTPWLWGWRAGLPGAVLNYLHTGLHTALVTTGDLPARGNVLAWWRGITPQFRAACADFVREAETCLLAYRLRDTVAQSLPDAVSASELAARREHIFGHPMTGGGMVDALLSWLEELIYRAQDRMA